MTTTRFYAVILAAGSGKRFRSDIPKQYLPLAGKTLLEWSLTPLLTCQWIEQVVVVIAENDQYWQQLSCAHHKKITTVVGGKERAESCVAGLQLLSDRAQADDWILVHDGARPCLTIDLLDHLRTELMHDAVGGILATPSTDTLKKVHDGIITETVDRSQLWQAQTPQMFRYQRLQQAYQAALAQNENITDDASALEKAGYPVKIVTSQRTNIKVTVAEDLSLAEYFLQETVMSKSHIRIGHGYDAHAFASERKLILGGVEIPHRQGLLGHSDADVVLHALCDALLGAAGLGDIGQHFPDTDMQHKDADSREFLRSIKTKIHQAQFAVGNVDITIVAQAPKLAPYMEKMKSHIAHDLAIALTDVNIKASTTEKMGFIGREEGMVAYATVLLYY